VPEEVRVDVALRVSTTTADTINRLARERNVRRSGLTLQALGLLQAAHDGAKEGYYLGMTKDRSKLDTVLIPPI
jgi:hypothetical protein